MTMLERKTVSQCVSADYCKGWNDAVDAMPKWISVEERLPNDGQKVMVCGLRNGMQVGAFKGLSRQNRNGSWWWKKDTILHVTHWMELPKPPEEET